MVRLVDGTRGPSQTLRLGVIRLAERCGGDPVRARTIAEEDLQAVPWLAQAAGRDLYLVGGAWRAMARIHMAQTGYPLNMVHHYTIGREEARDLAGLISTAPRKVLERLPGAPRRRIDDLPFAAVVLRRLLRMTAVRRVIFSASGLREGWFMRRMPREIQEQDPLLSAAWELAARHGRDPSLPPALVDWTSPLFPRESAEDARLREAVCWMSDIGSHDHPEFRAEQAFLRVLRQPGVGLDHHSRAFLALAVALRYEAESDAAFLRPVPSVARHRHRQPSRGARDRTASGLHAVGGDEGPADGDTAAGRRAQAGVTFTGEQRRVRRGKRDPAAGAAGSGGRAAGGGAAGSGDGDSGMIRKAQAGEAEAVRGVVLSAYERYVAVIGRAPGPMLDDHALRIAADQVWVLEEADGIAGVLVLEDGPAGFLLDNIAVRPDRQGRGFGRSLLDFAEAKAARCGCELDQSVYQRADGREHRHLHRAWLSRAEAAAREGVRKGVYGEAAGLNRRSGIHHADIGIRSVSISW